MDEIYYKVVISLKDKLYSAVTYNCKFGVEYKAGQFVEGLFPLFIFDTEKNARKFLQEKTSKKYHRIYKCEAKNPRYISKMALPNEFVIGKAWISGEIVASFTMPAPIGTLIADEVKITEQIF